MRSRGRISAALVDTFLEHYPDFTARPERGGGVRFVGCFERLFTADGLPEIADSFRLVIVVDPRFPRVTPCVFETAGRIPKDYHRLGGEAFCLSSTLRLARDLREHPDLVSFFERFVVPYLYRYAYFERTGIDPWPDLPHCEPGLLQDYAQLFEARSPQEVVGFLALLGMRKRVANKHRCPCGSGRMAFQCRHPAVDAMHGVRRRRWFRAEAEKLARYLRSPRKTVDLLQVVAERVARQALSVAHPRSERLPVVRPRRYGVPAA